MIFLIGLATLSIIVYWYFTQYFNYFKNQGIPGPKPVPIFGNNWGLWNKLHHEQILDHQKKYGKVYGEFDGRTPNLVIADTELMRKVFIKDFDHFVNRRDLFPGVNEHLSLVVGSLQDQKWKHVRSSMSPSFSSAKISKMISPMTDCAEGVVAHITDLLTTSDEINIKEMTTGYTLDVISSCGLGSKINSLWTTDSPFKRNALKMVQGETSKIGNIIFTICSMYPILTRLLPKSAFAEMEFFIDVSRHILKDKKSNKMESIDILGGLIQSSKSESSPFQDEAVLFGQVLAFMLAGFDTPATAMASVLHCLGVHQEIQDQLRKDIQIAIKKHGGITHECVQDLPFLDQCISEAMRLYPTNSKSERVCNKRVTYDNVRIEKGTLVTLPIYAIHHDPEIYPEPEKFKPERFSQEEKAKRDPLNFVPFGVGPRSCLGMRLAMEEMKIGLTHLIHNFRFYPSKNTSDPPRFLNGVFALFAMVSPDLPMRVEKVIR